MGNRTSVASSKNIEDPQQVVQVVLQSSSAAPIHDTKEASLLFEHANKNTEIWIKLLWTSGKTTVPVNVGILT